MNGLQPKPQRNVAGLKNRTDCRAEGLAALVALPNADPGALALKLSDAIHAAAMRADGAIRPNALFHICVSGVLIVEMFFVKYRLLHGVDSFNGIK